MQLNLLRHSPPAALKSQVADPDHLRPYQRQDFEAIFAAWERAQRVLAVSFTGSGKSTLGAAVAKHSKGRVLWLAMRDFLLNQASTRIEQLTGEHVSMERGTWYSTDTRIVVASVQSLRPKRLRERFKPDDFATIIFDEAHHAVAPTPRDVFSYFPKARLLGLTATPGRADKLGMDNVFEELAFRRDIDWGVENGYFCPVLPRARYIESIHLEAVKTTAGDLNLGGLEEEIAENAAAIAQIVAEECGTRQTIVYTPGVASAKAVAATLRELGKTALAVDGETPEIERLRALQAFRERSTQYLVNCALYTEGLDLPNCEAIVIARPTKSQGLYQQMAGRGGRPEGHVGQLETVEERIAAIAASSKPNFLLLDITGNAGRHSLCNSANAMAGNRIPEVVTRTAEMIAAGEAGTLDEIAAKAEKDLAHEQEMREKHEAEKAALANQAAIAKAAAKARVKSRSGTWDVFRKYGVDELDEGEAPQWSAEPATEAQVQWLKDMKLPWVEQTKRHVEALQRQAREWRRKDRASFRQRNVLQRAGAPVDVSFAEAKKLIDHLATHGWKITQDRIDHLLGKGTRVQTQAASIHGDDDLRW